MRDCAHALDPGPLRMKPILGSLINVAGFAVFLVVAVLSRSYWWGFILDIAIVFFLWRVARPAATRWTREVRDAGPEAAENQD
jgi:hypothetical protein